MECTASCRSRGLERGTAGGQIQVLVLALALALALTLTLALALAQLTQLVLALP